MAVTGSHPGALRAVLTSASRKALTRNAIRATAEAKRLAPKRSGALAASIHYTITGASPESMVAKIGSNLPYAEGVEKGTGIYGPRGRPITARRGQFMVFPGRKGVVFARSVKGQPGQHFLRTAIRSLRG